MTGSIRRLFLGLLFFLLSFLAYSQPKPDKPRKSLTLAFIQDGPSQKLDELRRSFQQEIKLVLKADYRLNFIIDSASSSFDSLVLVRKLNELLANQEVDIILGVGSLVSEIMCTERTGYSKPVIATSVFAQHLKSNLPLQPDHSSGVKNLLYLDAMFDPLRDLEIYFRLKEFHKVAFIVNSSFRKVLPDTVNFDQFFKDKKASYIIVEADKSAEKTLSRIPKDVDALYLGPLYEMDSSEYQKLIGGITQKKLPTFAMYGKKDVEIGAMSGIFATSNFDRFSSQLADYIDLIINEKEKPEDLVVDLLSYRENLYVNGETVREIGFKLQWQVINDAVLIPAEGLQIDRKLNFQRAVAEGLEYNLDARIARQQVLIGLTVIRVFRASLLPQLDIFPSISILDFDNGPTSPNPQYLGIVSGNFLQMIYDESEVARFEINRRLQVARQARARQVEMDVVEEVAGTYLELLQRNLIESVQTRNLKFSRENLRLAQERPENKVVRDTEISRWKTELSFGRSALLEAKVNRRITEMQLNRILARPVKEFLVTNDVRLEDLGFIYVDDRIKPLWDDPVNFEKLADFLVLEAKRFLPELQEVNAELYAQERRIRWRKRRFYVPSFYLEGGVIFKYLEEGTGVALDPIFMNLPVGGLERTLSWTIGVRGAYPVSTGDRRRALYQQAQIRELQLKTEKEQILLGLEFNVRRQLQILRVAYANIRFFKNAESEAFNNFYQMQYAYRDGQVTIVRLLDAQAAVIRARQSSINANYQFVQEIIRLERTLGFYTFLYTPLEKELYIQRLLTFLNS